MSAPKLTEAQREALASPGADIVDARTIDLLEWGGLIERTDWRIGEPTRYRLTDAGRAALRGEK